MTYAEVSTGFKGGGVNPRPFYAFQVQPFQPETVTTYEVGIKSQWFNNTLRANLDGYYSHYKDIQLDAAELRLSKPARLSAESAVRAAVQCGRCGHQRCGTRGRRSTSARLEIDASGDYLDFKYTSIVNRHRPA